MRDNTNLIICPACGFRFEGDLSAGCSSCGARAVGPPLAKPEHELPTYARALGIAATGTLMCLGFLASTVFALLQKPVFLEFRTIVAAAETAAWRLKWIALPVTIMALWLGTRICRTIRRAPSRFAGRRVAQAGLTMSAAITLLMAGLVGITVPERLRQRQRGLDAAVYAQAYRIQRALLDYRELYGTLPADLKDLKDRLADADGSLAEALKNVDYKPTAQLASAELTSETKARQRTLRGSSLRNASATIAYDDLPEGFSYTQYFLRLPGAKGILHNEEDWIVRDGVVMKLSEALRESSPNLLARPTAP